MENTELKEIKKRASGLKPMFNLGKAGITAQFIESIDKYLAVHEMVKVKVLIATDTGDITFYADEIAKETNSIVTDKRGYTFSLYRKITKQDRKDAFWANEKKKEEKIKEKRSNKIKKEE